MYVTKIGRAVASHLFPSSKDNHTDETSKEHVEFFKKVVKLWRLTPIWRVCNGAFYGQFVDVETNKMQTLTRGSNKEQLLNRINLVKSFS